MFEDSFGSVACNHGLQKVRETFWNISSRYDTAKIHDLDKYLIHKVYALV